MLNDDLKAHLQELRDALGVPQVSIVRWDKSEYPAPASDAEGRYEPLGNKTFLHIEPLAESGTLPPRGDRYHSAVVTAVMAIREAGRRWECERLPALTVDANDQPAPQKNRVQHRIGVFLEALANTQNLSAVAITLDGEVIAESPTLSELERERLPFLLRRIALEAERREGHSHADIADPDVYLANFWFNACLVGFFSGPYAVDFFRHRARLVMREVAQLLPSLDDPPPGSVSAAPIPE